MNKYYHTTKTKFLSSILKDGLQPIYGGNSSLTADPRTGKVSYSVGIQGTVSTFSVFRRFYNNVLEGRINEESFREKLSPEEYEKHQKSVEAIRDSVSFEDWIKDNIYLCFDENCISEKNEERPEDAYTTQSIPAKQLKVCVIKNKKDNTIYSYSMLDIYSFFYARNPDLKSGLGTYRYKRNIDKFKSDEYCLDYIDLERFCQMFPELLDGDVLRKQDSSKPEATDGKITPLQAVKNALSVTSKEQTDEAHNIEVTEKNSEKDNKGIIKDD